MPLERTTEVRVRLAPTASNAALCSRGHSCWIPILCQHCCPLMCLSSLSLLQLPYEQLRLLLEQRSSEVEVLRNRLDQREASLETLKKNYDMQVGKSERSTGVKCLRIL